MKIVIDIESIIKVFAVAFYAVAGGDYDTVKEVVTELFERIDYEPYKEIQKSEWIKCDGTYYCYNCKEDAEWLDGGSQQLSNFCPNCGAKMGRR